MKTNRKPKTFNHTHTHTQQQNRQTFKDKKQKRFFFSSWWAKPSTKKSVKNILFMTLVVVYGHDI